MPCYDHRNDECSGPGQGVIQQRAIVQMYSSAALFLTDTQRDKSCGYLRHERHPSEMLCRICKLLTEDQMIKVSARYHDINWPHKTLKDWYIQHLIADKKLKEEEIAYEMSFKKGGVNYHSSNQAKNEKVDEYIAAIKKDGARILAERGD